MICCLSEPKKLKRSYFFHCIESHCVESNRNRITLHRHRGESYRIALLAASYVSSMYRIVGYASRCVSHRPQLWRCTSLFSTASPDPFTSVTCAQGELALICEKHRAPVEDLPILAFNGKCQSSSTVPGSEHRAH